MTRKKGEKRRKQPFNERYDNRTGVTTIHKVCVDSKAISGLPMRFPDDWQMPLSTFWVNG